MSSRRRKVIPIRQRISELSDRVMDDIAWVAVCTAIMLAPLVFDGWMKPIERMIWHAISSR